jgi:quinol monooxygenase YgiN
MRPVTLQKSPLAFRSSVAFTATAVCTTAPPVGNPIAEAGIAKSLSDAQSAASRVVVFCARPTTERTAMSAKTPAPATFLEMLVNMTAYLTLLVLGAVSLGAQTVSSGDARYSVAYVEVQSSAVAAMRSAFDRYRNASRMEAGFGDAALLQQSGNPGLFVLVERWQDQAAADAHAKAESMKRLRDALEPIRVSGYDERPYKEFAVGAASPTSAETVYVVTHIDVTPPGDATALVRQLADTSRTEPGCLRFDVYQHTQRANHFTIVEAWRTRAARDRHAAAMHTRRYRDALQPMIGSPLDERLMRLP